MLNWLKRIRHKEAANGKMVVVMEGRHTQYPAWDMAAQMREGYEKNSVVYACVNKIANAAKGIPWTLFRETGGDAMEIEDAANPLLRLLSRPNTQIGKTEMVQKLFTFWLATGNGFLWANRMTKGGEPKQLWVLRPDRMTITPDPEGRNVLMYHYNVAGDNQSLIPEDVLHLKLFEGYRQEWFGLSPIQVGALLIDTDNAAVDWNRGLLKNRSRPDALFMFKQPLSDEQRAAFEARLNDSYSGSANVGRPMIGEGNDFTYQQLSQNPSEMDFVSSTSMTNRRICQLYNVPPELIGDPQNKTYSNQKEARLALVEEVVFPLMDYFRDALNNWLVPAFGDNLRLDYDKDSVDVIAEKRQMIYDTLTGADWLSVNEKRVATGYETIEDPDADVPERILSSRSLAVEPAMDLPALEDEEAEQEPEEPDDAEAKSLSTKMLNLDTEEKRLSFWADMDRRRTAMERGATKVLVSHFRVEGKAVVSAFKAKGQAGALSAIRTKRSSLESTFKGLFTQVGRYFFNQAVQGIEGGQARKDLRSGLEGMKAYLRVAAQRKAAQVTETTLDKIGRIFREGLSGGGKVMTDEEIVDKLLGVYKKEFEVTRAPMIAETETGNATNMGLVFGAKATEKVLKKVWVSMGDDRVRDQDNGSLFSHRDHTIKAVGINDLFDVSGEFMEFPGDSSHGASPGNVVNCRCYTAFQEEAS